MKRVKEMKDLNIKDISIIDALPVWERQYCDILTVGCGDAK